jgi:hypothetical protein
MIMSVCTTEHAHAQRNDSKCIALSCLQAARQFLLLTHLYARTDSASLAAVRRQLLPPWASPAQVGLWKQTQKFFKKAPFKFSVLKSNRLK